MRKWLGENPTPIVALLGVIATLVVAGWQIDANRDAANARARADRELQRAQASAQLQLAAVSVVLDAPSCEVAAARATLAKAVLGDQLPADFVDRVKSMRAGAVTYAGWAQGWKSPQSSSFFYGPFATGAVKPLSPAAAAKRAAAIDKVVRSVLADFLAVANDRTVACKALLRSR